MKIKFIFLALVFIIIIKSLADKIPFTTTSTVSIQEAQKGLNFHNKVRAEVGNQPLKLSAELANYAQAWANNLAVNNNCTMKHRPQEGVWKQKYGENIFWGSGKAISFTPLIASGEWYKEIENYQHKPLEIANLEKVGHYTQMIWHDTSEIGFGLAKCQNGEIIIVANYNPPGNYINEKPY